MKGILICLVLCALFASVLGEAASYGHHDAPWPNGPIKSLYIDWMGLDNGISSAIKGAVDDGYRLIILAFLVTNVPFDAAATWANITAEERTSTMAYVHSKGGRVIVSAGGATDNTFYTKSAIEYGAYAAGFAGAYLLDGVDFDLENFAENFTIGTLNTTEVTIEWVANVTKAARQVLGPNKLVIHTPQPPYFGINNGWLNAYSLIYAQAPTIDYLQVQFYNNGPATTYEEIFTNNKGMSVLEISQQGIPLEKIVVGKLVPDGNPGSELLNGTEIHTLFTQAAKPVSQGGINWHTGIMGWAWHNLSTDGTWLQQIYPPYTI